MNITDIWARLKRRFAPPPEPITISVISWLDGSVIFAHSCENNSMRTTLERAVALGVDLSFADLSNEKLNDAQLDNARLYMAKLVMTDLLNASLRKADLRNTWMESATLIATKFDGADLTNAKMDGATVYDAKMTGAKTTGVVWGTHIPPEMLMVAAEYHLTCRAQISGRKDQAHC